MSEIRFVKKKRQNIIWKLFVQTNNLKCHHIWLDVK